MNAALAVVYLKSDHSDEMELWPKVRSNLDATCILIWTTEKSDSEFQSYFSYIPNGISPSKKLQYYANDSDLIFCYAIRILNSLHDKPVAISPKRLF